MPSVCQSFRSAPQKQPIPKSTVSVPAGKGGVIDVPRTAWRGATGMACDRPGSAWSGDGTRSFALSRRMSVTVAARPRLGYAVGAGLGSSIGSNLPMLSEALLRAGAPASPVRANRLTHPLLVLLLVAAATAPCAATASTPTGSPTAEAIE